MEQNIMIIVTTKQNCNTKTSLRANYKILNADKILRKMSFNSSRGVGVSLHLWHSFFVTFLSLVLCMSMCVKMYQPSNLIVACIYCNGQSIKLLKCHKLPIKFLSSDWRFFKLLTIQAELTAPANFDLSTLSHIKQIF